jgi:putative solute:sodium symporter small subunit
LPGNAICQIHTGKGHFPADVWELRRSRAILRMESSRFAGIGQTAGAIMADGNEASWWRRTRFLAAVALATGTAINLIVVLSASALDAGRVLGIPSGLFGATLAVPAFVLLIIFWAAERQRRIDRAHGFF